MCGPGERAPIARARPRAVTKARLDRNARAMSDTQKWLAVAAIVIARVVLVPLLQQQIIVVIAKLPEYIDWVQHEGLPWLQQQLSVPALSHDLDSIRKALVEHWQQVGGVAAGVQGSVTSSGLAVIAWLANLVLIPQVSFYLLRDWDVMIAHIGELIPARHAPLVKQLGRVCVRVLSGFLRGQLSVMAALGTVYTVGLWLVGLDLALLIGVFAGTVSFVPYLGVILGVSFATIAVLMQYHDVFHLLLVFAVFGVGQTLESFVFTPWLVGDRIGLHPVTVIFAVMAGGLLFGFVGILLALPVAAVVGVLVRHMHQRYRASVLYAGGLSAVRGCGVAVAGHARRLGAARIGGARRRRPHRRRS